MSCIFIEGYTGIPRATANTVGTEAAPNPLATMGWQIAALYNGAQQIVATDSLHQTTIEADSTFATRNRLSVKGSISTSQTSYFQQFKMPLDTSGFEKFVIGMVFMVDGTATNTQEMSFFLAGPTLWTNSLNGVPGELFARVMVPNNGDNGTVYSFSGPRSLANSVIKKGKYTHLEAFIEQDVDRVRIYLDGILLQDSTYTGTFASVNGGFSVGMWSTEAQTNQPVIKVSDMYALGIDTVHSGVLGPGARVLEIAPQEDYAVTWDRPVGFTSNAAVLQQFNTTLPANYLTAGDPTTDLYLGPDAVAANAAQVYGAAVKAFGMTMADGTHTLTAATKYDGVEGQSSRSSVLTLSTMKNYVFDVSVNPATGNRWSPSQISASGIGIKLLS